MHSNTLCIQWFLFIDDHLYKMNCSEYEAPISPVIILTVKNKAI